MSIAEMAQATRVPARILRLLEGVAAEGLPADVFVRGYIKAYARCLALDEARLLDRYRRGEASEQTPTPLPAVYAPESGRRFGIAIALVILLILFTLALSIVLRPRQRDVPMELSQPSIPCAVEPNSVTPFCFGPSITVKRIASSHS